MATRTVQRATLAGVTPTYNSAASGDKFKAGPTTRIHVKNGDGSSHTVTPTVTQAGVGGSTVTLAAITVAAGAEKIIGPFPAEYFGDADGLVALTWSATTSMTWSVFA